jgi:hypothetical protein
MLHGLVWRILVSVNRVTCDTCHSLRFRLCVTYAVSSVALTTMTDSYVTEICKVGANPITKKWKYILTLLCCRVNVFSGCNSPDTFAGTAYPWLVR